MIITCRICPAQLAIGGSRDHILATAIGFGWSRIPSGAFECRGCRAQEVRPSGLTAQLMDKLGVAS